jgi:ribose-phosphate pyrophosphokinase
MKIRDLQDVKIFSGNGNPELAQRVCDYLKVPLNKAMVSTFADGEIRVKIEESIRGDDVFLIQSTCPPVNDNYMEMFIMLDAFRRASASNVTVVMPYMGYSRQDKKVKPREPITSRVMANLIETMGAVRIISVDLHAEQIQGFFNIPVDNLYSGPIIGKYYQSLGYDKEPNICLVSPDVSGVERVRNLAVALDASLAIIAKRRPEPNKSAIIEVIGDIQGKKCILLDDMVDTGGSILNGAKALLERGALSVEVACTHAILSKDAVSKIELSPIERFVCLDTITHKSDHLPKNAIVLPVAPLIGEAISRCHNHESVSELFETWRS